MRKRVSRAVAAVITAGALVSGCGSGPNQADAAAIVGDEVITLESIQGQLRAAASRPEQMAALSVLGTDTADLARGYVSSAVRHEMAQRAAAAEGITVSAQQVDAVLAGLNVDVQMLRNGVDLPTLRSLVRDGLIAEAVADRHLPGLSITYDVAMFGSRDEAERAARLLVSGGPAADEVLAGPSATRAQVTTEPTVLTAVPAGGVAVFQPDPQSESWVVLRVTDRRTDPAADPDSLSSVGGDTKQRAGFWLMQLNAGPTGIKVNPRYGTWDPLALQVVGEDRSAGVIFYPPEHRA